MAQIDNVDTSQLARAVVAWTGYKSAAFPTRDDAAIGNVLSASDAARLAPIVKALEEDYYQSQAHATSASLSEMKEVASAEFRQRHPDLPFVIADAFAWCYTYDYK